ncbi:MAG: hypothetical protein GF310_14330 [candidate division Zixibacteria bacterium]|nr:hypothetical protein [candidate division Zixibacteria bacterium]
MTAFMVRVPFENISKLYYNKLYGLRYIPDTNLYLDGIERFNFGGTCYSNNYYLNQLLAYMGYNAMLCGADMSTPDAHLVNIVFVDGREFLVDAGYAAPFLEPMPRDLHKDIEIVQGLDRYVLKPKDKLGNSELELHRDGSHIHGYTAKPIARRIDHFEDVIEDSFRDGATFMNSLLAVRFFPEKSIVINNLSIIESEGSNYRKSHLKNRDEAARAVEKYFSIPRDIVAEAISEIKEFGDAWS